MSMPAGGSHFNTYDTDEGPISGSELYGPIMSEEQARILKLEATIRNLEQLASPGLKIRELERRARKSRFEGSY